MPRILSPINDKGWTLDTPGTDLSSFSGSLSPSPTARGGDYFSPRHINDEYRRLLTHMIEAGRRIYVLTSQGVFNISSISSALTRIASSIPNLV